jgi:hypothetical protein
MVEEAVSWAADIGKAMAVESVPYGYPEPVSYRQRIADVRLPYTDDIPREVGKPTPYVNTGGLALAKVVAAATDAAQSYYLTKNSTPAESDTTTGYGSTGAATQNGGSASRGTKIDISA